MKRLRLALWLVVPLIVATAFALAVSGALPYKLYVVHTGSMWPTIPSRSAVIVQEHQYSVGEPISFVADGTVITHRLVAISTAGIITTKGDANATPDPWHVPTSAIIGGVVAAPRELGYWMMYLKNPLGLVSILVSALLLWQIWSLAEGTAQEPRDDSSTVGGRIARARRRRADRRTRSLPQTERSTATTLPSSPADVADHSVVQVSFEGRIAYVGDECLEGLESAMRPSDPQWHATGREQWRLAPVERLNRGKEADVAERVGFISSRYPDWPRV